MRIDWTTAGILALFGGVSTLITGIAEESLPWQALGVTLLFIWLSSCILAWTPKIRRRLADWLK